ncbi:TetR/AcrR family transcriptional regulator [Microbacterium sp. SS28]|uniref:TetR/AcrR family transcriptional regulator n=1 Tax=Microbacterium sp. SS28 TaxID=2919948 RepID=UPI001FAB0602|nr:TetR/AcrR family transcriptional regulator [Microbacterium sp. SS28]
MSDTGRRSYQVGRERRDRILDAAQRCFRDAGYSPTSLAEIARAVGLTTPGLKHHFATKDHLLLALAERRFDLAAARALDRAPAHDGTRALRMMYDVARLYGSQPELMELFVLVSAAAADPSSAAHDVFSERYERTIDEIASAFQEDVDAGLLREDLDAHALARECVAVADGLQLQWVLSRGTIDFAEMVRVHLERLAPGILRSGASVDLAAEPVVPAIRRSRSY